MDFLEVKDLHVTFNTPEGTVNAVNHLGFSLAAGETIAIAGESGSGKSQAVYALAGLTASNGSATGSVLLEGEEILNLPEKALNRLRAEKIAFIFQDPMTALNPFVKIGRQLMEVLTVHKSMSRKAARTASIDMLHAVKMPSPEKQMDAWPHEVSGGMKQRIMIAMALLCRPKLLIADEPTTALDVTTQAEILNLINELKQELNLSVIMITHDLGVAAKTCNRIMVMYGGQVMESGTIEDLLHRPVHPYTQGLLKSIPRLDMEDKQLFTIPGYPPDPLQLKDNCPFNMRCFKKTRKCTEEKPELRQIRDRHFAACFYADKSTAVPHDGSVTEI